MTSNDRASSNNCCCCWCQNIILVYLQCVSMAVASDSKWYSRVAQAIRYALHVHLISRRDVVTVYACKQNKHWVAVSNLHGWLWTTVVQFGECYPKRVNLCTNMYVHGTRLHILFNHSWAINVVDLMLAYGVNKHFLKICNPLSNSYLIFVILLVHDRVHDSVFCYL